LVFFLETQLVQTLLYQISLALVKVIEQELLIINLLWLAVVILRLADEGVAHFPNLVGEAGPILGVVGFYGSLVAP
jgi:hypothetical protein